jgi:dephospho-CoA kinase
MKVIGVIGQNGSGKDEVLKYLHAKHNIPFLSTGDMVREIAGKEDIDPTRENLQEISERYFREFGKGFFVKQAAEKILRNGWQIGGITGIRSLDDVQTLRNSFGKDFVLINIYISIPEVRYNRMRQRNESRDPRSYEQFINQDEAEEDLFHIQSAAQYADYCLNNDGSLDDLHKEIDELVIKKGLLDT